MVIFIALGVLTFHGCPAPTFLTSKALVFKSFLVNIFNPLDADHPIFLLEVTLRNPDSTYIVYPDIMTSRHRSGVSWFDEVVIVTLFLFFTFLSHHLDYSCLLFFALHFLLDDVFLLLFVVRTLFGVFIISWIQLFKDICIDMQWRSFHSPALDIAQRTR